MIKIKLLSILVALALIPCFIAVPTHAQSQNPAQIQTAIDDGIAWLAGEQNTTDPNSSNYGSWGDPSASDYFPVAQTGLALLKLEDYAWEKYKVSPLDSSYPYSAQVQNGLNYLFSQAKVVDSTTTPAMGPFQSQAHVNNGITTWDNPDTNGDGKGVYIASSQFRAIYETGIAMMAIAATRLPNQTVSVLPSPWNGSPVNNWHYQDVLQDAVDYLAYAQCDSGTGRGGWRYTPNDAQADNSVSGYAVIGLQYAENPLYGFNCIIPQFVRNELCTYWIPYVQNMPTDPSDPEFGGSGYYAPNSWVNTLKTGNLLCEMAFVGYTQSNLRVQTALTYIKKHWHDPNINPGWGWNYTAGQAYYQATYCLMKGLQSMGIADDGMSPDVADWYQDLADTIVPQRHLPDGYWENSYAEVHPDGIVDNTNPILCTAWALLTLERAAPPSPCGDNCTCMEDYNAVGCNFTLCNNVTAPCGENITSPCSDNIIRHCYTCPQGCECLPSDNATGLQECVSDNCSFNPCGPGKKCYKSSGCGDWTGSCDNLTNLVNTVVLNTGCDKVTGLPFVQSQLTIPSTLPDPNWILRIAPEVINPPPHYQCTPTNYSYPSTSLPTTSFNLPSPAWVIERNYWWVDTSPLTSRWISAYTSHEWNVNNSNPCPYQNYASLSQPVSWQYPPYRFERAFCVCSDNTDIVINFDMLVDNIADVYLDNTYIGGQVNTGTASFQQEHNINQTLTVNKGVHHLYIDVRNDSGYSMGLNVSGNITTLSGSPAFLDSQLCQPLGKLIVKKTLSYNSTVEPTDPGLPGWTVVVTDNATGAVTENTTDALGYCYFDLCPGTYTVSEQTQPDWVQTIPGSPGTYTVTVGTDNITEVDFGNHQIIQPSLCGDNCTCLPDIVGNPPCNFSLCDNTTTSCSDNVTSHCYTCPQCCECLSSDNATGLQECFPAPICPNPCGPGKKCYKTCYCGGWNPVTVSWTGSPPGTWTGPCGDTMTIPWINQGTVVTVNSSENCTGPCALYDVYFLADTTADMSSSIGTVQAAASSIMNTLHTSYPQMAFGVGNYKDFPIPPLGTNPYCFLNQLPSTTNILDAQAAITSWTASDGGDASDGQIYALQELASNPNIGWRPGAKHIIVWFGNSPGHDEICPVFTGSLAHSELVLRNMLTSAGITVLAVDLNSDPSLGLNGAPTPLNTSDYNTFCGPQPFGTAGQANRITAATNGLYINSSDANTIVSNITGFINNTFAPNQVPVTYQFTPWIAGAYPVGFSAACCNELCPSCNITIKINTVTCPVHCTCMTDFDANKCGFVPCDNLTTPCPGYAPAHCYSCPQGCDCLTVDNATALGYDITQKCSRCPCSTPATPDEYCFRRPGCECGTWDNVTISWTDSLNLPAQHQLQLASGQTGMGIPSRDSGDNITISSGIACSSSNCPLSENWTIQRGFTPPYCVPDPTNDVFWSGPGSTASFDPVCPGVFTVTLYAWCNGTACDPRVITMEVGPSTNLCTCQSWNPGYVMWADLAWHSDNATCGSGTVTIPSWIPGMPVVADSTISCGPGCSATYSCTVVGPSGNVPCGPSTIPGISGWLFTPTGPGLYTVTQSATCGNTICPPCIIQIQINTTQPCGCGSDNVTVSWTGLPASGTTTVPCNGTVSGLQVIGGSAIVISEPLGCSGNCQGNLGSTIGYSVFDSNNSIIKQGTISATSPTVSFTTADINNMPGTYTVLFTKACGQLKCACFIHVEIDEILRKEGCVPPQIVGFAASSTQITAGEQVTLSWQVTGTGNAVLTCGGEQRSVPLTGAMAVQPAQSGCCTLSVKNECGGDQKSACITVLPLRVLPPVINSFTANCPQPSPAARVVGACTLSWSVSGPAGTTVTISGIGSVGLSGSMQVPRGGTYTLMATSSGGSVSRTVQAK